MAPINTRTAAQLQTYHGTRASAGAPAAGTAERNLSPVFLSSCDDVFLCPHVEYQRKDAFIYTVGKTIVPGTYVLLSQLSSHNC